MLIVKIVHQFLINKRVSEFRILKFKNGFRGLDFLILAKLERCCVMISKFSDRFVRECFSENVVCNVTVYSFKLV